MDIEYLLSLQYFRDADGKWLAPVMNIISQFVPYLMFLIPIIIFWNAKRETGYWCLFNLGFADFVNNVVKLTACVYRPWVRDSRVHPWPDAVKEATGYSFPSGHTAVAAAVLGSTAVMQWKKRKWASLLMVFLVVLVAFSRNYLGVHTPQDVLVAMAETGLIIAFSSWLFRHISGNEKRQDIWTAVGVGVVLICLLWIQFKSYPMDQDAEGKLLVDPQDMMKDAFMSLGTMLGFLAGSFWERKRIHFDASGTVKERVIRSVIGTVVVLGIYLGLRKALVSLTNVKLGSIISMCLLSFFITGIYPWFIMRWKAGKA